jgi:hypothetical protein
MKQPEIRFNGWHKGSRHYSGKEIEKEYPRYEGEKDNF